MASTSFPRHFSSAFLKSDRAHSRSLFRSPEPSSASAAKSQASGSAVWSAFLGGIVFNLSNILLVAAIDIAGMAVAFSHLIDTASVDQSNLMIQDPNGRQCADDVAVEIEKLKDKKLLVVCRTGQTAVGAAASLSKMGAENVAILKGGMAAWRSDQFPVTTKK